MSDYGIRKEKTSALLLASIFEETGYTKEQLSDHGLGSRKMNLAWVRMIYFVIMYREVGGTVAIGLDLDRDHATVTHACLAHKKKIGVKSQEEYTDLYMRINENFGCKVSHEKSWWKLQKDVDKIDRMLLILQRKKDVLIKIIKSKKHEEQSQLNSQGTTTAN